MFIIKAVVKKMKYKKGDLVVGKVTGFEDYGIFLAFDDQYTGLIHISQISPYFVKDVKNYAQLRDEICCRVLECDEEQKKLKCSIRDTDYGRKKDLEIDHGFMPLKKQLPIWMEEKLREMAEKKQK